MPSRPGTILKNMESNSDEGGQKAAMRKYVTLLAAAVLLTVTLVNASASQQKVRAVQEMEILPTCWSPAETSAEAEFIQNLTGGSMKISSDLVTDIQDVTREYVGNDLYGVPENATRGYAYRLILNENACWDDEEPINASRWMDAIRNQLEAGNEDLLILANARAYLQGTNRTQVISLGEAGYGTVAAAQEAGIAEFFVDVEHYWGLGQGWSPISDITRYRDHAMGLGNKEMYISPAWLYTRHLADEQPYAYFQSEFVGISSEGEVMTWEDVGLVATGPYELTLILETPAAASYLASKLENIRFTREKCGYVGPEVGSSYGPYRVVKVNETGILLERNPAWWGEPGQYDQILCR